MAAAASSARPSTARTPSRNGPVPSRQITTARMAGAAARRANREPRLMAAPTGRRAQR